MDNLSEWEQECLNRIQVMTNDDLFEEMLFYAGGDDYDGMFTERGRFEYCHLEKEMKKRIIDIGFLEEK